MLATKQKVLRRFWHPIMLMEHLEDGPKPFKLLGEEIVVWKTKDGALACFKDRCPHRTAKLSMGFIEGDNLVCGYHGWTFNETGACVRIPQAPMADPTGAAAMQVKRYNVAERYGVVWVALDEPLADIPELPDAARPGFRKLHQFYEPWKIGALRLMENSFDLAHISFVHRATFGDQAAPHIDTKLKIDTHEYGFQYKADFAVVVRGEVAQASVRTGEGPTLRRTTSTYFMPFVRTLAITYPNGLCHTLVTCATPMDDETAMVIQWVYRNDEADAVNDAAVIAMDREITMEDRTILESCDPDVALAVIDHEEVHMASDRPGLVVRSLLLDLLHKHGEDEVRASPPPSYAAAAAAAE